MTILSLTQHYEAVKKYISSGPMLLEVNMNSPQRTSRMFMDSLLAFWPGLQVGTRLTDRLIDSIVATGAMG